jgi:hypothetical protein
LTTPSLEALAMCCGRPPPAPAAHQQTHVVAHTTDARKGLTCQGPHNHPHHL